MYGRDPRYELEPGILQRELPFHCNYENIRQIGLSGGYCALVAILTGLSRHNQIPIDKMLQLINSNFRRELDLALGEFKSGTFINVSGLDVFSQGSKVKNINPLAQALNMRLDKRLIVLENLPSIFARGDMAVPFVQNGGHALLLTETQGVTIAHNYTPEDGIIPVSTRQIQQTGKIFMNRDWGYDMLKPCNAIILSPVSANE